MAPHGANVQRTARSENKAKETGEEDGKMRRATAVMEGRQRGRRGGRCSGSSSEASAAGPEASSQ